MSNGKGLPEVWALEAKGGDGLVHSPISSGDKLWLVDERRLKNLDPSTGQEVNSIPYRGELSPQSLADKVVGAEDGSIVAFDTVTKEPAWRVPLQGWGHNVGVSETEGLVMAGSLGWLLAVDGKKGQELWRRELPGGVSILGWSEESRVVLADVGRYGSSDLRGVIAFDREGRELWSTTELEQARIGSRGPLFGLKERTFKWFGASSHTLRALDPGSGKKLWSLPTDACTRLWATPDGDLVVGRDKSLELRDGKTGRPRWSLELDAPPNWGAVEAGRTLALSGKHWVLTEADGRISGINPLTGARMWTGALPELPWATPAITSTGDVVARFGSEIKGFRTLLSKPPGAEVSGSRIAESQASVQLGAVRVRKRASSG